MTPEDFRRLALYLPEAEEHAHQGHPDFRVRGKIFATLGWPDLAWAMVKLTPVEQEVLVQAEPEVFTPVQGGWGRRGATNVRLAVADEATARSALAMAWRNRAPKSLVARSGR
ncbi:MAG: MmcQ/YjbR family DNA-binding protein [Pseudomonadota bacterium]|nr:MmcQ/YjbR family DNA-binding protein [Pseudomonadota bacterium]